MARLHEPQHGLLVVGPLLGEGAGRGELATAQLESDLEAIRVDVVEVLHAPSDLVPEGPVRDPLVEVVVLARLALPHQRVGLGVGEGEFLEQVVVGGPALAAALSLRAAIVPVKVTARGEHNILLGVVVRVAGDDGASVEVAERTNGLEMIQVMRATVSGWRPDSIVPGSDGIRAGCEHEGDLPVRTGSNWSGKSRFRSLLFSFSRPT
jgi:hypothetical protein